jgi:hypothetical protein
MIPVLFVRLELHSVSKHWAVRHPNIVRMSPMDRYVVMNVL